MQSCLSMVARGSRCLMPRPFFLHKWSLAVIAALGLAACGSGGEGEVAPPSDEALSAVSAPDAAVDRTALAYAIDELFDAEKIGETRALFILQDGKPIAERYAEGFGPDTPQLGWSLSKTVTGLIIGMMVADGSLALDAPAPVKRWQRPGDPRGTIALRHLLQMRSGLRHSEVAEPAYASDTARMLYRDGRDDMAHYALTQPLDDEAGSQFAYSTAETQILSDIATRALTASDSPAQRQEAMQGWLESRLYEPLGLSTMRAEYDARGTLIGGAMFHASARDWATIGELIRRGGVHDGVRIVPKAWIGLMAGRNPADGAYGAHLWRNHVREEDRNPVVFGGKGPADAVAALGHRGQYILVVPSRGLTVVRLGNGSNAQQDALNDAMLNLTQLFPAQ